MCVPTSFDEATDYISAEERASTSLHMNAQASLFMGAIQAYCQRTAMRSTNSGIPRFPDCLIKDGGKSARVLIVGIVRGMLGRGLSTRMHDNIVPYSKKCDKTDRAAIDIVWELYPRYQRWCANFVVPVQYISGFGCVPLMDTESINQRLIEVDEWLSKYEDNLDADSEEECSSTAPVTPANPTTSEQTPSKRKRSTCTINNKSCRTRLAIE